MKDEIALDRLSSLASLPIPLVMNPSEDLHDPPPALSFIVPAYDEESCLPRTLRSIHTAAQATGLTYEIVVVDDASRDRTAWVAEELGARVIRVEHRQISKVRNSGARAAEGGIFFFVDADTEVPEAPVQQALAALRAGAGGGGALPAFDGRIPWWAQGFNWVIVPLFRLLGFTGGCFLYCTRRAFEGAGGFDETMFGAEEIRFASALKRSGRFVVVRSLVITSGRKLRTHSFSEFMKILGRAALQGSKFVQQREGLELWYGERRTDPN